MSALYSFALIAGVTSACDILPRPGDTRGEQLAGRWEQRGRLVVQTDDRYTIVRLRVDTTGVAARHDVVLARFDFEDQYALTIGLELGDATQLAQNRRYRLGTEIPAVASVACMCRPLRPDSVRGTYVMNTRGSRQIAGRIDATLYFTAWDDSTVHATYGLHQRIHGIRP
jgi:hypothetical protein